MGEKFFKMNFDLNNLKAQAGMLFTKFPQNRLFIIIAGSILLLAVAGGLYSVLIIAGRSAADQELTEGSQESSVNGDDIVEQAEVLPQQIRKDEDSEDSGWSTFNPMTDPFGGPMKLTGIVTGGRGGPMAIVESSGNSYIVSEGDYVDDLWVVFEVSPEVVIMRAHNQEVSLYLDQAPVLRDLHYQEDVEDEEPDEDNAAVEDDPEEGA